MRNRASIPGGYVRKTVSLPAKLVERIENNLEPGETFSSFMTDAADAHVTKIERKGR